MAKAPEEIVAAGLLLDLVVVGSVASVAYGAWLVFPPAGFIVGGFLTLMLALGLVAGSAKGSQKPPFRNPTQPPRNP